MFRPVLLLALVGGCLFVNRDPGLDITSPSTGTVVTDHEPIQLFVEVRDVFLDDLELSVDGSPVSTITVSPTPDGELCDPCELRVTWSGIEAKEGLAVIGIEAIADGAVKARGTIDLLFEDTPEIARISPDADEDLAGYGSVRVEVDVIERGTATLAIAVDGEEVATRQSSECNRTGGCELSFVWDTSALEPGMHELHFTITDDKGKSVEDTRNVFIDDIVQITSLEVTGQVDDNTLEIEVYAFDASNNAQLGCAGSLHGLAPVDASDFHYVVDAALVKISSGAGLHSADLAGKTIRFEVWEDDDAPRCPALMNPSGNQQVGAGTAKTYEQWRANPSIETFGSVTELGIAVGRPRVR